MPAPHPALRRLSPKLLCGSSVPIWISADNDISWLLQRRWQFTGSYRLQCMEMDKLIRLLNELFQTAHTSCIYQEILLGHYSRLEYLLEEVLRQPSFNMDAFTTLTAAVILAFGLQKWNLIRLANIECQFNQNCSRHLWSTVVTQYLCGRKKCGGWTARKHNAFAENVGWQKMNEFHNTSSYVHRALDA